MKRLAVVIAAPQEAELVLANPAYAWEEKEPGLRASRAFPLSLALSGVGKVYAAWAYSRVYRDAEAVLSLGTSGGLSDEPPGGIWLAEEFVEHDMCVDSLGFPPGVTPYGPLKDPVMRTCPPWLRAEMEAACRSCGIAWTRGRAMAGDEFVNDRARAARKLELFGARVVDMESAAMAKLAASATGKPFAALRIVTDNANHDSGQDWAANVRAAAGVIDRFLLAIAASFRDGTP